MRPDNNSIKLSKIKLQNAYIWERNTQKKEKKNEAKYIFVILLQDIVFSSNK